MVRTRLHFHAHPSVLNRSKTPNVKRKRTPTSTSLKWPAGRSGEDLRYSAPRAREAGCPGLSLEGDALSDLPPGPQASPPSCPRVSPSPWRGPRAASQARMWGEPGLARGLSGSLWLKGPASHGSPKLEACAGPRGRPAWQRRPGNGEPGQLRGRRWTRRGLGPGGGEAGAAPGGTRRGSRGLWNAAETRADSPPDSEPQRGTTRGAARGPWGQSQGQHRTLRRPLARAPHEDHTRRTGRSVLLDALPHLTVVIILQHVYVCQIATLYTLKLQDIVCQLKHNKGRKLKDDNKKKDCERMTTQLPLSSGSLGGSGRPADGQTDRRTGAVARTEPTASHGNAGRGGSLSGR